MDSGFAHGWNRPIRPAGLTLSDELVALYVLNGLAVGPINPIASTVEQEITPVEMRARVFGAASAAYLAGIPLSAQAKHGVWWQCGM